MSIRHPTLPSFALAAAFALLAIPATSEADVSAAEASCRAQLSSSVGKYVRTLQKSVNKCHKLRNKGTLPPETDCNDVATADATAAGKVTAAEGKARTATTTACAAAPTVLGEFARCPAPYHATDDGGATVGVDDWEEMLDCTFAHVNDLEETMVEAALGLPAPGLSSTQQKCHSTIAKVLSKIVDTTLKERSTCQRSADSSAPAMEFACAVSDPNGKIAAAISKAESTIVSACTGDGVVPGVDSCADSLGDLESCLLDELAPAGGGGMTAMAWEYKGICSDSFGLYLYDSSDEDYGFKGVMHDVRPTGFYWQDQDLIRYEVSCDADCTNCTTLTVTPPAEACRCKLDAADRCTTNADCVGGGNACECFLTPPAAWQEGGAPFCATTQLDGAMDGTIDPTSGDLSFEADLVVRVHTGLQQHSPCPTCDAGVCIGGERDTKACEPDGGNRSYNLEGAPSYDCPPDPGSNVSGTGLKVPLDLTTGSFSMPFNVPCDAPNGAEMCACSTCSLNNTIACNSNTECAAQAAGVCRVDGAHGGDTRIQNDCADGTCSPQAGGALGEGVCLAGPVQKFCEDPVAVDGSGILPCVTDADCDAQDGPYCPGGDCGACLISQNRSCFLDPIEAEGYAGEMMVGGGCLAPSSSVLLNNAFGLPGAFRIRRLFRLRPYCPDGITLYFGPTGWNCP